MTPHDAVQDYLAGHADGGAMAAYLDNLAASEARERTGALARERDAMRAEIEALRQEQAALLDEMDRLRGARVELLVSFLPVVFRHFWTVVRPDELAMMCGQLAPPPVPSPCLEPSAETVQFMKAKLYALPQADRERIRGFCLDLRQRLQVRAELRDFVRQP
ncbi:hypothetical protein [Telluria beijingensis]|uniref:hypothetical protein n=1 Tax=Telluria beijingensis TaxID=3068633 RepID=UPI00279571F3|nr:hypothetical protein [Massilia sp. REN29]